MRRSKDHFLLMFRNKRELFVAIVLLVMLVTVTRCVWRPSVYLSLCVVMQSIALHGIFTGNTSSIRAAHSAFAVAIWMGACLGFEVHMVAFLSVLTIVTRRLFGGCLFRMVAAEGESLSRPEYDLLYAIPLLLACRKIAKISRST